MGWHFPAPARAAALLGLAGAALVLVAGARSVAAARFDEPVARAVRGASGLHARDARRVAASFGDVVVNEIDYDQPGADEAEFVELRNESGAGVDLGSMDVLGLNGGTSPATEYLRVELPAVTLAAGDYFVIGAAAVPNVDLVITDPGFLQNGAPDAVALVESEPSAPGNDVLIDSVSYEGDTAGGPSSGGSWTEGSGVGLDDSTTVAGVGVSRFPDGADTDANNVDLSRRCITPGSANASASSACAAPTSTAATPTATVATPTDVPPTATAIPATATAVPQTATAVPPTATAVPPTATAVPPTATAVPPTIEPSPTATAAAEAATATATPVANPPDATATATPTDAPPPIPLAVELVELSASRLHVSVVLRWRTASEIDNAGFRIYRERHGSRESANETLVTARGSELRGATYAFVDRRPGRSATYWLADVDSRGVETLHGPVRAASNKGEWIRSRSSYQ